MNLFDFLSKYLYVINNKKAANLLITRYSIDAKRRYSLFKASRNDNKNFLISFYTAKLLYLFI